MAIIGIALSPFTFGGSLALTVGGMAIGGTSGVVSIGSRFFTLYTLFHRSFYKHKSLTINIKSIALYRMKSSRIKLQLCRAIMTLRFSRKT